MRGLHSQRRINRIAMLMGNGNAWMRENPSYDSKSYRINYHTRPTRGRPCDDVVEELKPNPASPRD
jgi:hypothetical protein